MNYTRARKTCPKCHCLAISKRKKLGGQYICERCKTVFKEPIMAERSIKLPLVKLRVIKRPVKQKQPVIKAPVKQKQPTGNEVNRYLEVCKEIGIKPERIPKITDYSIRNLEQLSSNTCYVTSNEVKIKVIEEINKNPDIKTLTTAIRVVTKYCRKHVNEAREAFETSKDSLLNDLFDNPKGDENTILTKIAIKREKHIVSVIDEYYNDIQRLHSRKEALNKMRIEMMI